MFFSVGYVKINELHVKHTSHVTCNLSRSNNGSNDSYKKGQ